MARIPFWISVSDIFAQDNEDVIKAMRSNIDRPFTIDFLFDIVCGLTKMTSNPFYRSGFDVTSNGFNIIAEDVMILNKYKITDDPNF